MKTVNLEADFARAAYKRPSATLDGNYQLGSLTTGSPAGHLNYGQQILGERHVIAVSPLFLFVRAHVRIADRGMEAQCTVWPAGP